LVPGKIVDTPHAHSQAATGTRLQSQTHVSIANPGGLCRTDIAALHELTSESRVIAKGAHVRLREREPELAVLVVSGLLFRYVQARNGCRQIVALHFPGDWASVEAFFGTPLEGEIAAVVRTRVKLIRCGDTRRLLDRIPRIVRLLTIETLFQTGVQSAWLTRNSIMPATASLAHFLCEVVVRSGAAMPDGTACCPFPFTQQMIAEALGLTPVHVNRTFRVLRERGLADVTHALLLVTDLPELATVAEFDPHYLQLRSTSSSDPAGNRDFLTVVMERPFERSRTGTSL
jgi:CRP-like cAMP-binding protein